MAAFLVALAGLVGVDTVPTVRDGLYVVEVLFPLYDSFDRFVGTRPIAVASAASLSFARQLADAVPDLCEEDVIRIVKDGKEYPLSEASPEPVEPARTDFGFDEIPF